MSKKNKQTTKHSDSDIPYLKQAWNEDSTYSASSSALSASNISMTTISPSQSPRSTNRLLAKNDTVEGYEKNHMSLKCNCKSTLYLLFCDVCRFLTKMGEKVKNW